MKYLALLFCATFSLALAVPAIQGPIPPPLPPATDAPVVELTPSPLPTLAQDLHELKRVMQWKDLESLVSNYLTKDIEFQSIIRALHTYEAFLAVLKFKTQPEIVAFRTWLTQELGEVSGNESDLKLFNFCEHQTHGWAGFNAEFHSYYPEAAVRQFIQSKSQQGGSFAQFWQRVRDLRVVFDRFLLFPETQQLVTLLQEHNVDTIQLENFIRTQFDWVVPPTVNVEPAVNAEPPVNAEPVEPVAEVAPVA